MDAKRNLLRLMLIFSLNLWPNLSISQTRSGLNETILRVNEQAPFSGVLVPEERYRYYVDEVEKLNYELAHPPDYVSKHSIDDLGPWFLGGLVCGFISGLLVK